MAAVTPAEPAIQHGRVRLRLEVELEDLSPEAIAEILAVLRKTSGDSKLTIESISRGSSVLVVRGNTDAVKRLASKLTDRGIETVGGHTISSVEIIPTEQTEQVAAPARQQNSTDFELLKRWQAGDKKAGEELTSRHYATLQRFVRRKLDDRAAVAEIVQETWLNLLDNHHAIRESTNFRAFLNVIATRCVYKWYRERSVAAEFDPEMMSLSQESADENIFAKTETTLLYRALRELPAEEQLAIELFNWEEISAPDIAELTGTTLAVVRHRLRRGREKLEALILRFQNEPGASAVDIEELEQWAQALKQRAASLTRR